MRCDSVRSFFLSVRWRQLWLRPFASFLLQARGPAEPAAGEEVLLEVRPFSEQ